VKKLIKNNIERRKSMTPFMSRLRSEKGMILPFAVATLAIMIMLCFFFADIIQRDAKLIDKVIKKDKARYIAEAGVQYALADLRENGFSSRVDFSGSLDTGSYVVTYTEAGGRYLATSTGTVPDAQATVTAEIMDNTPTALFYFSGAGNDIKLRASGGTHSVVNGDLHANNEMFLRSAPNSSVTINGDVSATGTVKEGSQHYNPDSADADVIINGVANDGAFVEEGAPLITFPVYNFSAYKEAAIDGGGYYSSSQSFNDQNLSPAGGIVYIDGSADFHGDCTITGGIVADDFNIHGTLSQSKSGTRNVIIASDGDIAIHGRLYAEEAVVDAQQDIESHQNGATLEINGTMIARRNVNMWNVRTTMIYTHVLIFPPDMEGAEGIRVVSWNK